MKILFSVVLLLLSLLVPVEAQVRGFTPCAGNTLGKTLSVTGTTSNVQLSTCGPTVFLFNIGDTEAFFAVGPTSAITATTSSFSLPASSYIMLNMPAAGAYYVAAITASSTTTVRIVQGVAQ